MPPAPASMLNASIVDSVSSSSTASSTVSSSKSTASAVNVKPDAPVERRRRRLQLAVEVHVGNRGRGVVDGHEQVRHEFVRRDLEELLPGAEFRLDRFDRRADVG